MIQTEHRRSVVQTPEQQTSDLVRLLEQCATAGAERRALIVRIGALPVDLARPHHLPLIETALEPLCGLDRARKFKLRDNVLVLTWHGEATAEVDVTLCALRQLFDGLPTDPVELLELPRDTPRLARVIAGSLQPTRASALAPTPPAAKAQRPLDPVTLAALEAALAQADVAHFVHRKPVYTWPDGAAPRLAWEKRGLAIREIAAMLAPGIRPQEDGWLFRRLTRTFDRRVLALLSDRTELSQAGPFALDLNVASIVGPEFLRFDACLPPHLRGHVVLGLLPADILADAASYTFARDFARPRGYRLMLRQLTPTCLRVFPPELLGVDLVQLRAPEPGDPALPDGIAGRAVLSGTRSAAELEWGRGHGIRLFEGSFVQAAARRPSS